MSIQLYARMGGVALAGTRPVGVLLIILYPWVQEVKVPRLDLDFRGIERGRLLIAVPMLVSGSGTRRTSSVSDWSGTPLSCCSAPTD